MAIAIEISVYMMRTT